MKRIPFLLTLTVLSSSAISAPITQPVDTTTSARPAKPRSFEHDQFLATSYATAILVGEGKDITEWKGIQAMHICRGQVSIPAPGPGPATQPSSGSFPTNEPNPNSTIPVDSRTGLSHDSNTYPRPVPPGPPTNCAWEVLVTTRYELQVCPNGEAKINRFGYGVTLKTKTTGVIFEFGEVSNCGLTGATDIMAPFDLNRVERTYQ